MNQSHKSNAKSKRYNDLLKRAWEIHRRILPVEKELAFGRFDIFGWTVFANDLGGDHRAYVDFRRRYDLHELFWHHETKKGLCDYQNRIGLMIADVSGHDFEDLLLVHNLHSSFFTALPYEIEKNGEVSEQLFDTMNMRLVNSTPHEKYVSAIYMELGVDRFVRMLIAGHPLPLLYNVEQSRFEEVSLLSGPPLGLLPSERLVDREPELLLADTHIDFRVNEFYLPEESVLILYTDGITEIEDRDGKEFGLNRLKEVIAKGSSLKAKNLFNAIIKATDAHREKKGVLDDRTLVIIKC